jgi:hypothetical protein
MEQPLDLTLTNTKNLFTIEYLTSNIHNQKQKPRFYHQQTPLSSVENKSFSLNEHVVPNISSPSPTVSDLFKQKRKSFF